MWQVTSSCTMHIVWLQIDTEALKTYLRHKDKAECNSCAEDDEQGDDEVGSIRTIFNDEGYRYSSHTHDDDVVDAHANVFGVVESRDAHMTSLPGQKTTKYLQQIVPFWDAVQSSES